MSEKPPPPKSTINEAALAAVMAMPHTLKNMHGSTAGSGSGDFHQYRGFRRTEQERISAMEAQAKKEEEEAEFQKRRAERIAEVESKAAKKSAKRKKQKEKERERKKSAHEERRASSPVAPAATAGAPKETATTPADGTPAASAQVTTGTGAPATASVRAALAAQSPFDAVYGILAAAIEVRGPAALTDDQRAKLSSAFEGLQLGAAASRQLIAACASRGLTLEVLPDDAFDSLPADLPRPRGPAEYFRITAPPPLTFVVLSDGAPFLTYATKS